jgi:hypothetical protein
MIENLRKYTGLIIFVIALLFVGLAFFGDPATMGRANANNPVVLTVDGTSYTATQYRKLAEAPASDYSLAFQTGTIQLIGELGADGSPQGVRRFFVNRLNLRQACEDFGIHPSDQEIEAHIKETFTGQDGQFSQERYNSLVKSLGRYGMLEKDLLDLIRDSIASEQLKEIIGSGLGGTREAALESAASTEQQVSIQVARTALATFQEQIKPTDEELKAAWETTKEKYMVERKIKVSYLIAKPTYPERPAEAPKLPDAVTEEAKKAAEKEAAEKKAKEDAEYAEKKRLVDDEVIAKVDALLLDIQNSEGKDFEKLVAEDGWTLVTTELFTRSAVPAELQESTVSDNPRPVADLLFQLENTDDPLTKFTEALPLKDNAFIIARLDGEEEARPKTFEEAKEEVRTDYIAQKANEALKKDADEKAAKIREGLAAGKPFADLAKEVGLEPKAHGPFKATDKLEGEADVSTLFQAASTVEAGKLADPVIRPDSAVFIFVEKRELVKDPARDERINQAITAQAQEMKRDAYMAWLAEKLEQTQIEEPSVKR